MFENTCIYEVNVRQMTPEGTFKALWPELDRLADLGVGVLWFMPIQPIGLMHRKGQLGSYYAISDYTAVNPEFGTLEEFIALVEYAHQLGMKVLLDWVANHTAPDHVWTAHPDWHQRDQQGALAVQYDWTDITELNYQNLEMRQAMIEAMRFWLSQAAIDGFRCDMAMLVPTDFWREAFTVLRQDKPEAFFLAEAEQADLMQDGLFDAFYAWKLHHTMNAIAQGTQSVHELWQILNTYSRTFPSSVFPMAFTSNHDENSHSGTEFERLGDAALTMAALTFMLPTWPLIYTGQELGNRKRLAFFEKDQLEPQQAMIYTEFYKAWLNLRKQYPLLACGVEGAPLVGVANDRSEAIFSFKRVGKTQTIYGIFNLSAQTQSFSLCDEDFDHIEVKALGGKDKRTLPRKLSLRPWAFEVCLVD